VEAMILDSFDRAEEDITARQVIEAKNEAQTILDAVEKGEQTPAWQQLTSVEHEEIRAAAQEVKASLRDEDYKIVRKAIEQLDKKTRRFAEIMMDTAVSGALQGKTMNSAGESMGEGPSAPHPFAKAQIEESKPQDVIQAAEKNQETAGESEED
jgi:molecular chaperone DnaK/molecular chaperone HscA